MQLPIGFQVYDQTEADSESHYILKLNKNLYGLKQGSYNWYKKRKKCLFDQGFKASDIYPFLYIGKGMIVLTYVEDCIILGKSMIDIDGFVESMKNGLENFVLTDEVDIKNFLGIGINQLNKNIFKISQPFRINRIIYYPKIDTNNYGMDTTSKLTPVVKPVLNTYLSGKPHKEE